MISTFYVAELAHVPANERLAEAHRSWKALKESGQHQVYVEQALAQPKPDMDALSAKQKMVFAKNQQKKLEKNCKSSMLK